MKKITIKLALSNEELEMLSKLSTHFGVSLRQYISIACKVGHDKILQDLSRQNAVEIEEIASEPV